MKRGVGNSFFSNNIRIEVYQTALKALKREKMLQSINSKYPGIEITIEDVLTKVHFLSRLKIPFIISVLLLTIINEICQTVGVIYAPSLFWLRTIYVALFWLILNIGYIIYGRKLLNLMPPELVKKVRKVIFNIIFINIRQLFQ